MHLQIPTAYINIYIYIQVEKREINRKRREE